MFKTSPPRYSEATLKKTIVAKTQNNNSGNKNLY